MTVGEKARAKAAALRGSEQASRRTPNDSRQFFNAAGELSIGYVEVHGPVGRLVFSRIHGLHNQKVGTRLQVVHLYLHSYGDNGIPLLDELLGALRSGEKDLFVAGTFKNRVSHGHRRRVGGGHQRLINLAVDNDVVRVLETVAAGRNDLQAFDDQRRAILEQHRVQARGNVG